MALQLDHTIVPAYDKVRSAEFIARLFGLAYEGPWGHFAPVRINDALTLDFDDAKAPRSNHYASPRLGRGVRRGPPAREGRGHRVRQRPPLAHGRRELNHKHRGRGFYLLRVRERSRLGGHHTHPTSPTRGNAVDDEARRGVSRPTGWSTSRPSGAGAATPPARRSASVSSTVSRTCRTTPARGTGGREPPREPGVHLPPQGERPRATSGARATPIRDPDEKRALLTRILEKEDALGSGRGPRRRAAICSGWRIPRLAVIPAETEPPRAGLRRHGGARRW